MQKSDKILVGFFQSFSIFNSSQVFFLASFLSLIGFLIWFAQPLSSESEAAECAESLDDDQSAKAVTSKKSSSPSASVKSNHLEEDHESDHDETTQRTSRDSLLRGIIPSSSRYPIDTIYESANENIYEIQEKTILKSHSPVPLLFNANVTKIQESSAVVHDHRSDRSDNHNNNNNNSNAKSLDKYSNQYFISNQASSALTDYSNQATTVTNSSSSSLASSRQRLEKLESDDGTNELINNLIDNLLVDEAVDLPVSKREVRPLEKANSTSSENVAGALANEIRNSILGICESIFFSCFKKPAENCLSMTHT